MTEQQRSLYTETAKRLARLGANDPTMQIIALAEEIERYRDKIHALEGRKRKRYTAWDPGLGRFVVPLLFRPDGEPIKFYCKLGGEHNADSVLGRRIRTSKEPDLVYGEVIDWLAELENKEGLHETNL